MAATPQPGPRLDLHVHSHHSRDALDSVARLVRAARERGLQGLALTDHDSVAGHEELARLAGEHPDLLLLPGCEVSTREGHLLAYGVASAPPKGRSLVESLTAVGVQGGVAVLAHPFRFGNGVSGGVVKASPGVAVEVVNGRSQQLMNRRAGRLARELTRPVTGGSDAHRHQELGRAYTRFPAGVESLAGLLEALRSGGTVPGGGGLGLGAHGLSKVRGVARHVRRRLAGDPARPDEPASPREGP